MGNRPWVSDGWGVKRLLGCVQFFSQVSSEGEIRPVLEGSALDRQTVIEINILTLKFILQKNPKTLQQKVFNEDLYL